MSRSISAMVLAVVIGGWSVASGGQAPQQATNLSGTWKLNRELSQFHEVGFGMDAIPAGGEAGAAAGVASGWTSNRPLSEAEARNMRQIVEEVRTPPAFFTVVQDASAVTVTDDHNRVRTFHPDGREDMQHLDAGPMATVARWEGERLIVRYRAAPGREVQYSLWRTASPVQLHVLAELIERGGHDTVLRVYEPAVPGEKLTPSEPEPTPRSRPLAALPSQPADQAPRTPPAGAPAGGQVPAAGGAAPVPFDQSPGAEFKGLRSLGVVVEELGSQAESCGVKRDAIEEAVSKPLADAGLKVVHNSDEDTYLYVNVITAMTSAGYCFSRYDAHIYTNTTAQLSYGTNPVLVQVLLLHRGGISGSGASGHGEAVQKALAGYVTQFAETIRNANR